MFIKILLIFFNFHTKISVENVIQRAFFDQLLAGYFSSHIKAKIYVFLETFHSLIDCKYRKMRYEDFRPSACLKMNSAYCHIISNIYTGLLQKKHSCSKLNLLKRLYLQI